MNTQKDEGPLENISAWLKAADFPSEALISIGATRYTPYGEAHFLQPGDRSIVILYDSQQYTPKDIQKLAVESPTQNLPGLSLLNQLVTAPE